MGSRGDQVNIMIPRRWGSALLAVVRLSEASLFSIFWPSMTSSATSGPMLWQRGRRQQTEPQKILRFLPTAPNLSQCSGVFEWNASPIEAYIHITSPLVDLVVY
jgi:hypothetical protein